MSTRQQPSEDERDGIKAAEPDFRSLFESVPSLYLVLLPDFTIVAVSDAYLSATMTRREEIVGQPLFKVFPDNPEDVTADGVHNLRSSLNLVLKHKRAHTMAIQKYDIRKPDGSFEERYWSPLNKPVLDARGEVAYIVHRVEDATEFVRLQSEQVNREKITDDLRAKSLQMEIEIMQRSKEIQKLNEGLEEKVRERTSRLVSLHRDVSDYKFALDSSSIVAVTDQRGIIQYVNENFCRISKYKKDELIGRDHRIVNSGYHPKEFIRELWGTIAKGRICKGEIRNRAKDGDLYWVDTTIVPFLDEQGKPYKYLAIRADITERKRAEERILKLNEELENMVRERTLELTLALEREQSTNEMKSRFVSIASHEFRTPLSIISSSVSLAEQFIEMGDQEKFRKHIARVKSSVKNMVDILNEFLSLDKLEQGVVQIERETINLDEFYRGIVEEVGTLLKSGQCIQETHTGSRQAVTDKKILRNILLNLLSNAIKYSPPDKTIQLNTNTTDTEISIKVIDSGIGIPKAEQQNIFTKFYRAYNAHTAQGTGLGLVIVKRYVELLNGTVSFESEEGQGSEFKVVLPNRKVFS